MRRAVIVDVVRTPFGRGRAGGALSTVHPVDLYAGVLKAPARMSCSSHSTIEPAFLVSWPIGC